MSVMSDEQIYDEIVSIVTGNRVAERVLDSGVEFIAVDILPDPRIRQQLTAYSSWPTTPQLFVGGELIGGCDIVEELHAQGELDKILGPADAAS